MEQLYNESTQDRLDESPKAKDEQSLLDVTTDLTAIPAYTAQPISNPYLSGTTLEDVITYMRWSEELKTACEQIRTTKDDAARRKLKEELLPYFMLARYKDNHRKKVNFESAVNSV